MGKRTETKLTIEVVRQSFARTEFYRRIELEAQEDREAELAHRDLLTQARRQHAERPVRPRAVCNGKVSMARQLRRRRH